MLDKLKARTQLARQIDVAQHKANKEKHEKNWLKETADAMDIELDSDFADRCARLFSVCLPVIKPLRPRSDTGAKPNGPTGRQRKAADSEIKDKKLQLKQLLAQPLLAQGISKRYITSGSNPIVHELLAGESESTHLSQWRLNLYLTERLPPRAGHETMLGVKKTSAGSDLLKKKVKRRSKNEYEWSGFGSTS